MYYYIVAGDSGPSITGPFDTLDEMEAEVGQEAQDHDMFDDLYYLCILDDGADIWTMSWEDLGGGEEDEDADREPGGILYDSAWEDEDADEV